MRLTSPHGTTVYGRPLSLALATLILLLPGSPAGAYQSVIRQGQEAPEVPNENDFLGWSLATGDFDGDGFDDLASGAPSEDEGFPLGSEHGAVIVNYGSARGITHLSSQFLTVGAVPDGLVHFGIALAAGNFNNDAYDDLAVGLPDLDGNLYTIGSSGEVWIYLGGPTGLSSSPNEVLDQSWEGDPLEALDQFGRALTTGYFNDDAYADLAVGSPGEDSNSGAVYVFYGQAAGGGISSSGVQRFDPTDFAITGLLPGRFGLALAAGDLRDTGEEELAIGAPLTLVDGQPETGRVYLVLAGAGGLTATGGFYYEPSDFGYAFGEGGQFGAALTIGNFWDEATLIEQLVIGAPESRTCDTCDRSGLIYVTTDYAPPFAPAGNRLSQDGLGILGHNTLGDRFGHALAAGDWDDDGFDDLAVSIPGEDFVLPEPITGLSATNTGRIAVWIGGDATFSQFDANIFNAATMNDSLESGASIGWSLAFGRFDDSGRANLAVGAPLKDFRNFVTGEMTNSAGQVFILAPWRQPQGLPHRSSAVTDCNGQLVYAQRPFQAVTPASVTKAMTVLLAVEAFQAGAIDTNDVYTVPDWVANNVSGSQAGLVEGEQIKFGDLIKLAVSISAGDACYAIGDTLTGGNHPWNGLGGTLVGFANLMNTRAMQIGMDYSHFSNPSGRPLADNFTAAYDWLLFAQTAMQNPLYRYYVGTRNWLNIPNYSPQSYGWLVDMQDNWWSQTVGIKPGGNGISLLTGLWAADDAFLGRYEASGFGCPSTSYGSPQTVNYDALGQALLQLAFAECSPGFTPPPPGPDPDPNPWGSFPGIPTGPSTDPPVCFLIPLDGFGGQDAEIEVFPLDVPSGPADFEICVQRISEVVLGPGESATFTADPVGAHLGFRIFNILRTAADLQIDLSDPVSSTVINLPSEDEYLIPAANPVGTPFSLTIQNLSSVASVRLELEEKGYKFRTSVDVRPFAFHLSRDPHQTEEVIRVCLDGLDPTGDNTVSLSVHAAGQAVVAVEPPPVVAAAPGVRVHAAIPNPFTSGATLAYELDEAGPVWIAIHDVAGRRIRILEDGTRREPGRHVAQWDGRDDAGARVPAGIYFQQVRTLAGSAAARVVRLR